MGIYSDFYETSSYNLAKNVLNKWPGEKENKKICALWGLCAAQNGSFLPTFRDHLSIQFSRIKQSKKKHTRYVFVLFPGFQNNLKKKDSKRTFPTFLLNTSKWLRTETYPSSHAKNTTALASFRLSWKIGLFDSLNVCLCSSRTFEQRVFTHLLKQNSTRTGLSGIYVLRTSGRVYGKLFLPQLNHTYYYYYYYCCCLQMAAINSGSVSILSYNHMRLSTVC
jgi:hypothetical protein